jgi:hypothetical protein
MLLTGTSNEIETKHKQPENLSVQASAVIRTRLRRFNQHPFFQYYSYFRTKEDRSLWSDRYHFYKTKAPIDHFPSTLHTEENAY